MEQAPHEDRIIRQCMMENRALPKAIENAPQLEMGLELYYNAYWDLTSCRASSWGVGPISWLSIAEYAMVFEFSEDQTSDLMYYIRVMDNAYLNHKRKKEEGKKCQPQRASGNSQREWKS